MAIYARPTATFPAVRCHGRTANGVDAYRWEAEGDERGVVAAAAAGNTGDRCAGDAGRATARWTSTCGGRDDVTRYVIVVVGDRGGVSAVLPARITDSQVAKTLTSRY